MQNILVFFFLSFSAFFLVILCRFGAETMRRRWMEAAGMLADAVSCCSAFIAFVRQHTEEYSLLFFSTYSIVLFCQLSMVQILINGRNNSRLRCVGTVCDGCACVCARNISIYARNIPQVLDGISHQLPFTPNNFPNEFYFTLAHTAAPAHICVCCAGSRARACVCVC